MPLYARSRPDRDFIPCPDGLQRAVCCDVVALGLQDTGFGTQKEQVKIKWQSQHRLPDGRPFIIWRKYTLSLNPKSNLRKDLETWRGKPMTDEEAAEFDMEKLLGVNCQVLVVHHHYEDGGIFARVDAVMPPRTRDDAGHPIPALEILSYEREPWAKRPEPTRNGFGRQDQGHQDDVPF